MKTPPSLGTWRVTFLASLGLLGACGGNAEDGGGSGGRGGSATGHGGMSSGGAGSGGSKALCEMSTPILANDGSPTGFETCSDGLVHRTSVVQCWNELPRGDVTYDANWTGECKSDADCTAKPYGYCAPSPGQVPNTYCAYGCGGDDDCAPGFICECGPRFGVCVPSNCRTDAHCPAELCAKNIDSGGCADGENGPTVFACTFSNDDSCRVDSDCMPPRCVYDGVRSCQPQSVCGIGRPFLVDGNARVASLTRGADWQPSERIPTATPNRRAAAHYQRAALLEHASVAAFARFTLELLALGAPADLVAAASSAMADETLHARLCFGLAARFGAEACAPGPLAVEDALGTIDLEYVLMNAVLEGCIGESIAAEEAARSLEFTRDPEVERVLERIADDERRHAELAFRFLDWALSRRPELAAGVRELVRGELESSGASKTSAGDDAFSAGERGALGLGVFPDGWRPILRDTVLREFVLPCVEALCSRHDSRKNRDGLSAVIRSFPAS